MAVVSCEKARPNFILNSSNGPNMTNNADELREAAGAYRLDLPVGPAWFSKPPRGTIEDGIQLSLGALDQIKSRPEIFAQRDQRRCDVEFKM